MVDVVEFLTLRYATGSLSESVANGILTIEVPLDERTLYLSTKFLLTVEEFRYILKQYLISKGGDAISD